MGVSFRRPRQRVSQPGTPSRRRFMCPPNRPSASTNAPTDQLGSDRPVRQMLSASTAVAPTSGAAG